MTKRRPKKKRRKLPGYTTGAPTLYDPRYHPQSYIELSRKGRPKFEICATWGIDRGTLHDWSTSKKRPELIHAMKIGDELRTAWWASEGEKLALGKTKNGNGAMMRFMMTNICSRDFRMKIDHAHTLDVEDMIFEDEGEDS